MFFYTAADTGYQITGFYPLVLNLDPMIRVALVFIFATIILLFAILGTFLILFRRLQGGVAHRIWFQFSDIVSNVLYIPIMGIALSLTKLLGVLQLSIICEGTQAKISPDIVCWTTSYDVMASLSGVASVLLFSMGAAYKRIVFSQRLARLSPFAALTNITGVLFHILRTFVLLLILHSPRVRDLLLMLL